MTEGQIREVLQSAEVVPLVTTKLVDCTPSDTGNADRFVRRFGDRVMFVPQIGWHVWDGCRWQRDEAGQVIVYAQDTARLIHDEASLLSDAKAQEERARWAIQSQNAMRIVGMLRMARPHCAVSAGELDAELFLFNVQNGTLDLRAGRLRPHQKSDRITKISPATFDPNARAPRFDKFLLKIFDGNQELIGFVRRMAGYSLTGSVAEQCFVYCYGPKGNNGKSTLLNVLRWLLGDYGQNCPAETLLAKPAAASSTTSDLARLRGARFVSAAEPVQGRRMAESLVKQLTGSDAITARHLYKEWFEFLPAFKLWLAANHRIPVRDDDAAIWRRVMMVPFDVEIPKEDRIADFDQRLRDEGPGILNWCLEGCSEYQRDGLRPPRDVVGATETYRQEMDVLSSFLAECFVEDADGDVSAKRVRSIYEEWCKDNGERMRSQKQVGQRLSERGYDRIRRKDGFYWVGLRAAAADG